MTSYVQIREKISPNNRYFHVKIEKKYISTILNMQIYSNAKKSPKIVLKFKSHKVMTHIDMFQSV